jgi:hypothetical protein
MPWCCFPSAAGRGAAGGVSAADEASLRAACELLAESVATRVGAAPKLVLPTPATLADDATPTALLLARRASLRAQWDAAAAVAPILARRGTLARTAHGTARADATGPLDASDAVRRTFSLIAQKLLNASTSASVAATDARGGAALHAGATAPVAHFSSECLVSEGGADDDLLDMRLAALGLRRWRVAGDGNCQYRALARFVAGTSEAHGAVRAAVAAHLRASLFSSASSAPSAIADTFAPLFESAAAFGRYVDDVARPGTWGDELTLAAAAEALGAEIHVLQSTPQNWHLVYTPSAAAAAGTAGTATAGAKKKTRRVFLAYVAPVHYDAVVLAS